MITAFFLIMWLSSTALLTFVSFELFSSGIHIVFTVLPALVVSYFIGLLLTILFVMAHLPFMKLISTTHPYKAYINTSAATFFNRFVLRLKIKVEGRENIPVGGVLTVFANHKSNADPFILLQVIKRPLTFTPKMSVYRMFWMGSWLKTMGAFPIDRSSDRNTARAMIDAIKEVKNGNAMMIFPEGGIKDRLKEDLVALRAGAFKVTVKAGADILPIRLIGTTEIKHRAPWRSTQIKVVISKVIPFESFKDKSTSAVAEMVLGVINHNK
jgi:1-acyl-sn-glycerol-3-phosphate acyltransferase